jgi:L-threonine-O-3-phosphate decarboxylase
MNRDAVADVERVPHGGTDDRAVLDFSASTNPDRPEGLTGIYDAALASVDRYPADGYCEFRTVAADYVGCAPREVLPTAGGLQALRLALSVTLDSGDTALVPAPSFGEFAREVRLQGATPEFVAHDAVLDADPSEHAAALVCNPNNPTGEAYPTGDLQTFAERCRAADTTLVIDEAYLGFTDRASLAGTPGVVVCRSLTKLFGIPGLRVGFAVATDDLRERLDTVRQPWAVSTPAREVGTYCMRQTGFVEATRERVTSERARMRAALADDYDVFPSDSPFLLLDVGDRAVADVLDACRERDIAIRDATTFRGLDSHVRVAVKRPDQNDRLLAALLEG